MKAIFHFFKTSLIFIVLTVLTQIGGVVYLFSKLIFKKVHPVFTNKMPLFFQKLATFLLLYSLTTFLIIPPLAKLNNRVPLPYFSKNETLRPTNLMTVFLNRHYVRPQLKQLTETISTKINKQYPGTRLTYLDANFPFWNGFPLLPHISHNDGKKIDLSFLYSNKKTDEYWHDRLTFTGYGFCEMPRRGEVNQPAICAKKGYWQYNFLARFVNKNKHPYVQFDEDRNKILLKIMANERATGKVLIEPHLEQRLHLSNYAKIRYHGCHAVRHDDHIHLQL